MLRNAKIKASIANGGMMFHKKIDGEHIAISAPESLEGPRQRFRDSSVNTKCFPKIGTSQLHPPTLAGAEMNQYMTLDYA